MKCQCNECGHEHDDMWTPKTKHKARSISVSQIAQVAHGLNKAYCEAIGDSSHPLWKDAPEWQRDSAIEGVGVLLAKSLTPRESHRLWMNKKLTEGWEYGPVKNTIKKEHPCLLPYDDLPEFQRIKDHLFIAVVTELATLMEDMD